MNHIKLTLRKSEKPQTTQNTIHKNTEDVRFTAKAMGHPDARRGHGSAELEPGEYRVQDISAERVAF